jgi:hypothetical protein
MAALARLGPWMVSDEIYHGLTYEGPEHTILEFTDRAFVLNGFSKAYAMTGWRCGYVIAPAEFMPTLTALHGNFFISSNEFVQWAALAALREAGAEAAGFRRVFDERRQAMVAGLRRIGLGVTSTPTGAFYVLANAPPLHAGLAGLCLRDPGSHARGGDAGGGLRAERGGLPALRLRQLAPAHRGSAHPARPVPLGAGHMSEPGCVLCERVAGEGEHFIADLDACRAYFNPDQFFPGWVFVVLRWHARELYELSRAERARVMEDVSWVARRWPRSISR